MELFEEFLTVLTITVFVLMFAIIWHLIQHNSEHKKEKNGKEIKK